MQDPNRTTRSGRGRCCRRTVKDTLAIFSPPVYNGVVTSRTMQEARSILTALAAKAQHGYAILTDVQQQISAVGSGCGLGRCIPRCTGRVLRS